MSPATEASSSSSTSASTPNESTPSASSPPHEKPRWIDRRWALPLLVYLVCASVYVAVLGSRRFETSPDNHYAHLAHSWLQGQLHLPYDPPGTNDWACYDTETRDLCPNGVYRFGDSDRYRWYVSFPPFPGVVMLPAVAIFGVDLPDRFFFALLAGLGPMLLFLVLRRLRETGRSTRTLRDELLLTVLFAFGTVFFFVAVQGTVWFSAHVVAVACLGFYLLFGLDARRPILAGLALGCCFLTRPTTAMLALFFAVEALRSSRKASSPEDEPDAYWMRRLRIFLRGVDWKLAIRKSALFAAPILVVGAFAMWHNAARFDDPFEWGHSYLQIRWRPRIETWGLFNYHYAAKNLAVFAGSLPWLSAEPPHVQISGHGLALWFTTPALFFVLAPRRTSGLHVALWLAIVPVMLLNLGYQNSGWVQFGYRFALDYLPLVFVLLAIGARRFGVGFALLLLWSVAVNGFGAATFDRAGQYYVIGDQSNDLFQPD